MAKFVFVVGRSRPSLYETLRPEFADEPAVRVVIDRRLAERRNGAVPSLGAEPDRRRAERRVHHPEDGKPVAGYALVVMDATSSDDGEATSPT